MSHPPLIFVSKLSRPVDAAHTEYNGRETVDSMIVPHILVSSALRAAIRRVEVQGPCFEHAQRRVTELIASIRLKNGHIFKAAVHLVGGGEDKRWTPPALAHRLKHIKGAKRINLEIRSRI